MGGRNFISRVSSLARLLRERGVVSQAIYLAILVLSPFWFCRRFGVSPFWICRRFGFVAVLVLSPFWRVAVLDLSRASSAMNCHAL